MLAQSILLRPPRGLRLYSFQRNRTAKTVSRGGAMMSNVAANPGLSNLARSGNDKPYPPSDRLIHVRLNMVRSGTG
jgi:hypothetical protein